MPKSWHHPILKEFIPQVASLTLVADPDSLLTEENLLQAIQARGFELILFEDPVAFRFTYESKYRTRQKQGDLTELVIVLRAETQKLESLPYDLLQLSRQLSFSLRDLFPNLSYHVIQALDHSDLDILYQAQTQYKPQPLGDNTTKDFVLQHIFAIAPELVNQESDLLLILLRRHYRGQRLPSILDDRLIQLLRERELCSDWPLETIIPDRQAFFTFLQQRWPRFVTRQLTRSQRLHEPPVHSVTASLADLPFDAEDVRVYINNLFLEGYLQPISIDHLGISTSNLGQKEWVTVGLQIDPVTNRKRRLEKLLRLTELHLPAPEVKYQDWLTFAYTWAELIVLWHEVKTLEPLETLLNVQQQFKALQQQVDTAFLTWVKQRYGGLYNQPKLVMLHQIPCVLARHLQEQAIQKVALLVLDGLSLDQWLVLQEVLLTQRPQLRFRSEAVFAWLPTITSVSRQAVFAGKLPLCFPNSIYKTDQEATLWKNFWAEQGLNPVEIAYAKGLGEDSSLFSVEELLSHPKVRVVGLVVDKVDRIMHGMELGTAGMHNQVRQWANAGFIAKLIDQLHNGGFSTFLTSDHGNIEAVGIGRPSEGAIADLRGERVRVYPDPILRARVKAEFPNAIDWPPLGLPENYLPLLASERTVFIREGERIVGHGGISLEELVVPFIHVER